MSETNEKEAATVQQVPHERVVMRKVDFYWSDRWQRVINVYRCSKCGKDESDLKMKKPEIERRHVCDNGLTVPLP